MLSLKSYCTGHFITFCPSGTFLRSCSLLRDQFNPRVLLVTIYHILDKGGILSSNGNERPPVVLTSGWTDASTLWGAIRRAQPHGQNIASWKIAREICRFIETSLNIQCPDAQWLFLNTLCRSRASHSEPLILPTHYRQLSFTKCLRIERQLF